MVERVWFVALSAERDSMMIVCSGSLQAFLAWQPGNISAWGNRRACMS